VKLGALVALPRWLQAKLTEVVTGQGGNVIVELELNTTQRFVVGSDIEVAVWFSRHSEIWRALIGFGTE